MSTTPVSVHGTERRSGSPLAVLLLALCASTPAPGLEPTPTRTAWAVAGDPVPGIADGELVEFVGLNWQSDDDGRLLLSSVQASDGIVSKHGKWLYAAPRDPELVALEGQAAPGTTGQFDFPGTSSLTRDGVSFQASLKVGVGGVTSSTRWGIWGPDGAGNLELVARQGDAVPGLGGPTYRERWAEAAGNAGSLHAMDSTISPDSYADLLVAHDGADGSNLGLVAGSTACPDPAGETWSAILRVAVNDQGDRLWRGRLTIDGAAVVAANDSGFWRRLGGVVEKVAREGDAAPGAGAGVVYGELFGGGVRMLHGFNDAGDVAFTGVLAGAGVAVGSDGALFGPDGAGGVALVAREGATVPGVAGTRFVDFYSLALDHHGALYFAAALVDGVGPVGEGGALTNQGLFRARPGEAPTLLVRTGEPAPGGGAFTDTLEYFDVNRKGEIVFSSNVSGQERIFYLRGATRLLLFAPGDTVEVEPGESLAATFVRFEADGYPSGGEEGQRQQFDDAGRLFVRTNLADAERPWVIFQIALHPSNAIFWHDFEWGDADDWSAKTGY